jgi:ProP effector
VKKDSGKLPKEKPVVVIRRKAGTKSLSSHPTQPTPRASSSVAKAAAPASPALHPAKPQQPVRQPSLPVPAIAAAGPSKKKQEQQARRELLDIIRARWPKAFPLDFQQVKPLAIGIKQDIATQLPQQPLTRISVTIGIFEKLMGPVYYRAVLRGGPRYDLEGNPRGEVTSEEREKARQDLTAFFDRRKGKAPPSAPTPHDDTSSAGVDENKK